MESSYGLYLFVRRNSTEYFHSVCTNNLLYRTFQWIDTLVSLLTAGSETFRVFLGEYTEVNKSKRQPIFLTVNVQLEEL